jgi:2-haloacid dehalogenase
LRWHDPASPGIYRHLLGLAGTEPAAALLVSSNPFDIAGAGATGMRTAWCKRQPDALFDPWGPRPEYVIRSLSELAGILPAS